MSTHFTAARRTLLRGAAAAVVGAVAAPFAALAARAESQIPSKPTFSPDYGPLRLTTDQTTGLDLLMLPDGFEYLTFGWRGDEMSDGIATPGVHDGMAAFARPDGKCILVRNHEIGDFNGKFADPAYNPLASAGTTSMIFDPATGSLVEARASLSGTLRNCAGGATPWRTWLTCEETTAISHKNKLRHGYVFEVPADGAGDPRPITAMGRFSHEAVAVDPATGYVYETEDDTPAGFYRYRPNVPGNLAAGGVLEMLVINGGNYDTGLDGTNTVYASTSWVQIAEPDAKSKPVSKQGLARGGAIFTRLEGAFYADGKIYIVSTTGGPAGLGQIFEYEPATGALKVLFASPSGEVLNNPDNICVSPRGGLVLCEDNSGMEQHLQGLTTEGEIFPFAMNNVVIPAEGVPGRPWIAPGDYRDSEWCGSTFEAANGDWLFANLQSPGITVAITGPWSAGAL